MANGKPRSSGIFGGILLLSVGTLLLIHNYRGLDVGHILGHWWPLPLILLGIVKLYERTAGRRFGETSSSRITGGEIFLVVGMLILVGLVVAVDLIKKEHGIDISEINGESYSFDVNVDPKTVPANARIVIRTGRGNINVRSGSGKEIRVSAKKTAHAWNEESAQHIAEHVTAEIVQNGDTYEIRPAGFDSGDSRISLNLDVTVPEKSSLTLKTEKGDIVVSEIGAELNVMDRNGDVEIRGTNGDVSVEVRKGDVKISDTRGNLKISGKGGQIDASSATGSLTIDGDFYGPIRADKIAKGLRYVSMKTDMTVSQLAGHMELGSGNLEILDAPGNLAVRTRDNDVSIENAGGKLKVENRNGNIELRFASPPKEDIDVTNSSSGISLSLPGSSSFEIQADCQSCNIDSEFSGPALKGNEVDPAESHHLEGKYGNGRGPKISLKTSYGSISLRRTTGSIPSPPPIPALPPTRPSEL
ncbi:MAG: hypothetical protein PVS2B2_25040 [Candidatus Acidiferrum sp.]